MIGEKFVEQAKNQLLYERQGGGGVEVMLARSSTNTRVNQEMARLSLILTAICTNWRGNWYGLFADLVADMQCLNLGMDGYARVQAIQMAGAQTTTAGEVVSAEKKGGFLGLFGK